MFQGLFVCTRFFYAPRFGILAKKTGVTMKNAAVIAAGGAGARMGAGLPKQFMEINGKPLIVYCLEVFESHADIGEIIAACPEKYFQLLKAMVADFKITKLCKLAAAGKSRQESVYNGLELVSPDTDIVLIHDAARPFIEHRMITDNIKCAAEHGACGTVFPAEDTIVTGAGGFIGAFATRDCTYHMQTPQSFKYDVITGAHRRFINGPPATDDCGLAMWAGAKVAFVMGDKSNLKVTTREDVALMYMYLGNRRL